MDVLTITDLTKQYRHFTALAGLTMHVPQGAIYGLVGQNGAGKTTLIRQVCGLQTPSGGTVTLFGIDHREPGIVQAQQRIGAVVETPSVYLDMTAAANLRQQYQILGLPADETIPALLQTVGLADTGKKKVKHFSLGMRQRLGIAIALAGGPDFLILDEPANGLDPQGIIEIRELILKLNREQQITFLISSHILDELARLATHYGFIDHGRMVREVSAAELQKAFKKRTVVTVNDTRILARVLTKKQMAFEITDAHHAAVFDVPEVTAFVMVLATAGCTVQRLTEVDESLESYYINLVGGGQHA